MMIAAIATPMNKDDDSHGAFLRDNNNNNNEESPEPPDPADVLMSRGFFLRKLRELERQDEEARRRAVELQQSEDSSHKDSAISDVSEVSDCILDYTSYLSHQRFYDDMKHVDYQFIDFGPTRPIGHATEQGSNDHRLVIEQDKAVGKGGLCWDAAFCLGEHLIRTKDEWLSSEQMREQPEGLVSMVELGAGTGVCGMMVAKAISNVHVSLTDLPSLLPLMSRNAIRNFERDHIRSTSTTMMSDTASSNSTDPFRDSACDTLAPLLDGGGMKSHGFVSCYELDWDDVVSSSQNGSQTPPRHGYDVVVGADVVATLYNPTSLAQTIHTVAKDEHSLVYISFKERLSTIHRQFEAEMALRFQQVEIVSAGSVQSRNRNPDIGILVARGKKR